MSSLMDIELWQGKTVADFLTPEFLAGVVGSVLAAIAILIVGVVLAGWVRKRILRLGQRYPHMDATLFNFAGNIGYYVIIVFALLIVMNTFGIQTTSIVAIIGSAGLAIGLALQGTLSNVAAGVMIILFRPIRLGDFVEVNGVMGTVKEITLNFTELASLENVQIIVPNAQVWGNVITNYSTYDTRRAEWSFGVGYGANLAKAEQIIRDTIMADPRSHTDPEPFIQVNTLNASSVDFLVRVWCDRTEYFAYHTDMTRKVKEALDDGGIEIPYPTQTIFNVSE